MMQFSFMCAILIGFGIVKTAMAQTTIDFSIVYDAGTNGANTAPLPITSEVSPNGCGIVRVEYSISYTIDPTTPFPGNSWTNEASFQILNQRGDILESQDRNLPGSASDGSPISGSLTSSFDGGEEDIMQTLVLSVFDSFNDQNEDGTFSGTFTYTSFLLPGSSCAPSGMPSGIPSSAPTRTASSAPSQMPSSIPSDAPSSMPSSVPSDAPSDMPSSFPSLTPSMRPSAAPSALPSTFPSVAPSDIPSLFPSSTPTERPRELAEEGCDSGACMDLGAVCEADVCVLLLDNVGCGTNDDACSGDLVCDDNVCVKPWWWWGLKVGAVILFVTSILLAAAGGIGLYLGFCTGE